MACSSGYGGLPRARRARLEQLRQEFIDLSDKFFARFVTRLDGLTDEEYLWKPVPDAWSLVPGANGTLTMVRGIVFDEQAPVTTIAWRYTHIIDLLCEDRCATWVGLEPETDEIFTTGAPATAAQARELLDLAFARWKRYVSAIDMSRIFEKVGPIGRQFADATRAFFVLHILDEVIHHGAEIGVLRDLWAAEHPDDPMAVRLLRGEDVPSAEIEQLKQRKPDLVREAAATERWEAIPRLIDLGFGVGTGGRTAMHHAAGSGRLDAIRLLIDSGAPTDTRDPVYKATPAEWAEFFGQKEASELLRSTTA